MQGHHSAKPHTSCQVPHCHVHTCCSRSCELVDNHALSKHRSRVHIRRQFLLPAYTRVINFCHIFGRGNGGRLIRGTAYMRVYTVRKTMYESISILATILHDSKKVFAKHYRKFPRVVKERVILQIAKHSTGSVGFYQFNVPPNTLCYRSYRGRVFTGQKTKPTVSKHWRKMGSYGLGFNDIRLTPPCYSNTTCSIKIHIEYTYVNTNESTHSEMDPVWQNPIQRR